MVPGYAVTNVQQFPGYLRVLQAAIIIRTACQFSLTDHESRCVFGDFHRTAAHRLTVGSHGPMFIHLSTPRSPLLQRASLLSPSHASCTSCQSCGLCTMSQSVRQKSQALGSACYVYASILLASGLHSLPSSWQPNSATFTIYKQRSGSGAGLISLARLSFVAASSRATSFLWTSASSLPWHC